MNIPIVQPYLFMEGQTDEALKFYQSALGAKVTMLLRMKDNPDPASNAGCVPPGSENKVMHAQFQIGDTVIMASDGRCTGKPSFQGFALSLTLATDAAVNQAFAALSEGGEVQQPLDKTFFSARFGMVIDKFGVFWMVMVCPAGNPGAK